MARFLAAASAACIVCIQLAMVGCATPQQSMALGIGLATQLGGQAPANEIEQTYYLGAFDPQEQLPPSVYRVRVRGQASFISGMKFASGWVRAEVIDSLGSTIGFSEDGKGISIVNAEDGDAAGIASERRMLLFGPEGFREAPKNHRLVIVMGSDPSAFFTAVDETVGVMSRGDSASEESKLQKLLLQAIATNREEQRELEVAAAELGEVVPRCAEGQ